MAPLFVGVTFPKVGLGVTGVMFACAVPGVPVISVWGVLGVDGVPPPAVAVCAAAVCLANSSIIAIGFSTDATGETNSPVGNKVGVATGAADKDCVQAEINNVEIMKIEIASTLRRVLLIDSPQSK